MNPNAQSLAQVRFQAALGAGISRAPLALSQLLAHLGTNQQTNDFDPEDVGHNTGDELPFLRDMIMSGKQPDSPASIAWESSIRWVLSSLNSWDPNEANSINKLRALFSTLMALDANSAGLSSIATQLTSRELLAGIKRLIESSDVRAGFNDLRFPDKRHQIESLVLDGNLERLWQVIPQMVYMPPPDFWTAIIILFNADQEALVSIIEMRNNIYFSLMVCTVLDSQALDLACRVNNGVFKFISVAHITRDAAITPISNLSFHRAQQTILLQIAQKSAEDWSVWMRALFKYPGNSVDLAGALGAILDQLSQEHWEAFFSALSLEHSQRSAAPVANILIPFANKEIEGKNALIWTIAYQIWNSWNYGQRDKNAAMFAPVACALDFPVAMYYASQSRDDLLVEESKLIQSIEMIELQWFDSATDLVTERNKLKSRLRLLQHGFKILNGSAKPLPALPAAIQPDPNPYNHVRYLYYDVNIH